MESFWLEKPPKMFESMEPALPSQHCPTMAEQGLSLIPSPSSVMVLFSVSWQRKACPWDTAGLLSLCPNRLEPSDLCNPLSLVLSFLVLPSPPKPGTMVVCQDLRGTLNAVLAPAWLQLTPQGCVTVGEVMYGICEELEMPQFSCHFNKSRCLGRFAMVQL